MSLASMTVSQLKEEAAKAGVTVKTSMKKADIIAAIEAAQTKDVVFVEAEVIDEESGDEPKELSFQPVCNVGKLSANFDALEKYVDGILAEYKDWEPSAESADDVKQCADHKKYLNALATDLDSRRKSVKEQYLKPLNAFELRANAIRDKIKATSGRLNDVVVAAKNAERDAKYEALKAHYEEFAEFLVKVVPYERLHDPKWLNKEPKLPRAKEELEARVNAIAADWENLKSLGLEFFDQAEAHFFSTLSLGDAVAYNNKLADDRRKIEDMKANMDAYSDPVPEPALGSVGEYEPFDPMTMEPERVFYKEPQMAPAAVPIPVQAPIPAPVSADDLAAQFIEAVGGDIKKAVGAVMAKMEVMKPDNDALRPRVMMIEAATVEQIQRIGQCCGAIGVTGRFSSGTLQEVYDKKCGLAAHRNQGQVFQYGA